jgi:SAM-dependent methyltransferase
VHAVPADFSPLWADPAFLRDIQYADDRNLAARQSIYVHQDPRQDLPSLVIDSLALAGGEAVVDVGCGNGLYLAGLASRGHRGPVAGIDMSPGMLAAARSRAPAAHLIGGDAANLPLRTGSADVALAMHMLYHVPEPARAIAELRRVTRPGGLVVVGLNGEDHLTELRDLVNSQLGAAGLGVDLVVGERIRLDQGQELLADVFASVIRHDLPGQLRLPGPQPVADYVRSMSITQRLPDQERLVETVTARLDFGSDGRFGVTTHCGWLICA